MCGAMSTNVVLHVCAAAMAVKSHMVYNGTCMQVAVWGVRVLEMGNLPYADI